MALVSYVDILEVVGELKDFRVKLIEGEGIAKRGAISKLCVKAREKGVYDISASCQSNEGDETPYLISISVVGEPRLLHCKCSCLDGGFGKCQHVVATLMHIHRNNITLESSGYLETGSEIKEPVLGAVVTTREDLQEDSSSTIKPTSSPCINGNSVAKTAINSGEFREENQKSNHFLEPPCTNLEQETSMEAEVDSKLPDKIEKLEESVNAFSTNQHQEGTPMEVDSPKKLEEIVNALPTSQQQEGIPMEVDSPRLGRGQRKQPANPKYSSVSSSDAKRFVCTVCSKGFGKKAHYEEHVRSHTGEKPFVCDICGQGYSQKRSLLRHKEDGGKGGCRSKLILKCHVCDCPFKTQSQLDTHLLSHSFAEDFRCSDCDTAFDSKKDLEEHKHTHAVLPTLSKTVSGDEQNDKKSHTGDNPYKCTECGKSFSRLRSFKAHKHDKQDITASELEGTAPPPRKRTVIKCETCGKEFTNRVHHEEHVRSHTGERPFQCVECGKGFATKRSLRNHSHLGKNARNRPHKCPQCPASFITAFMLKVHERGHSGEKPFKCDCGKAYRSQHVYQDHLNQHKGVKAHTCKICGKSFTWRTSLWAHTKEHAKEKPFECVQCGAMFAEQSDLKCHWEVHLDDKPFQCHECGVGFMLEVDCEKHLEIHKKSPSPHPCTKCDQKFVWKEELTRHMLTHKEKKKSLCPTCGQIFSSKGHLKVHMQIHTGDKPFECETCHKRFYTRSLMRKHAVFHSGERPFECVLCLDKFPTQAILRNHIRTHTGEKPFTCEKCGKSFPQSSYLKRHMLSHSGERPFPCTQCENAFVSRYDLKIHLRTHTGEKPFACEECDEQFYERTQLTTHQRIHTGEKPHKCDICGKGFNNSNHIKKHFGRVHPDIAPFGCADCNERFEMREDWRTHRKSSHLLGADIVLQVSQLKSDLSPDKTKTNKRKLKQDPLNRLIDDSQIPDKTKTKTKTNKRELKQDPLNRLIEDSQILVDETSNTTCDEETDTGVAVLPEGYEIVHVNLVDSSQLMKLPDGFRCERVQVYHAESLADFARRGGFQAVSIASMPDDIAGPPHLSIVVRSEANR